MIKVYKISSIVLLIPLLVYTFLFGKFQFMEGYNPIDPSIDTVFTVDYTEEKFDQIEIGMDSISVIKVIGKPFNIQNLEEQNTLWYFTHDGKCSWHDFAWLGREIKFDENGNVIKINKYLHYD